VLRASSTPPLAQEYVADGALYGSNGRYCWLRWQFPKRYKLIPKQSWHDGWQLCGDSNGHERYSCRVNNRFSIVTVKETLFTSHPVEGVSSLGTNVRHIRLLAARRPPSHQPNFHRCRAISIKTSTTNPNSENHERGFMSLLSLKRKSLLAVLLPAVLLSLGAMRASADTVTIFDASGTFADGSTLLGTIDIDVTTGVATGVNQPIT
jgi:hypothetical protein